MAATYPVERGASDGHAGKGPALSEAGQGDARRPDLEQHGDGHEEEGHGDEQRPAAATAVRMGASGGVGWTRRSGRSWSNSSTSSLDVFLVACALKHQDSNRPQAELLEQLAEGRPRQLNLHRRVLRPGEDRPRCRVCAALKDPREVLAETLWKLSSSDAPVHSEHRGGGGHHAAIRVPPWLLY